MNRFPKILSVVLILVLVLSVFNACGSREIPAETEDAPAQIQETSETQAPPEPTVSDSYYQVGDRIEDFTVTTYDGRALNLYEVLEEKDMVLLNLWATWCGPCASEFPAMQEAYEQYQDKVEIFALSEEPTDTDAVLAEYVQEKGMNFCVARDTAGVSTRIKHSGIPTSIIVDRFGIICLIEEGAMPDPAVFSNLFKLYTAEDYTKSLFLPSMLAEKPDVQPADPEALNEALNAEGGNLVFTNSSNEFHWPMIVEQKDGRTVAAASNSNSQGSKAVVETQVDVQAGDVLVVEFKLDNDVYLNNLSVEVDGKSVKKSAVDKDWGTYAYRFDEAGIHQIGVCYEIESIAEGYSSSLWIDSIEIVSGEDAAKALDANAKYPVGEKTELQILNENIKKAYFYDEADPDAKQVIYFCADPTVRMLVKLDETVDPETAFLGDGSNNMYPVALSVTEDGFVVEYPCSGVESATASAILYCDGEFYANIDIFNSEEQANQLFELYRAYYGLSLKWEYWDESAEIVEISGDVTYIVTYLDQNGEPVPGVMCQVCDDSMCQVFVSDANGICQFTLPAKSYEIHTLKLPDGYDGDTSTVTNAPMQGGELTFSLTKK